MRRETDAAAGWYMDRGGPERTGAAVDEHLRLPLQLKWKVKTALHADREPLTWGGGALLWSNHEEWSVDISSGKRLGTFTVRDLIPSDPGYRPDQVRQPAKGNGILTAIVDPRGFAVAFVPGEHRLYARDLPDLAPLWDQPAPPVMNSVTRQLFTYPPVVLPGRIMWTAEGPWAGCLDSATGAQRWLVTLPFRVYQASSDGRRILVGTDDGVTCLDVDTGALLWTSPIGKTVQYVALADGVGYACPQGKGLVALDLETGKVLWSTRVEPAGLMTSPCVFGDGVYGGSMRGLFAFSKIDGRALWRTSETPPYRFVFDTSAPVATQEHIIIGGGVFEHVYIFSRENGALLWAYKTKSMVHSNPVVYRGKVLIGSTDRHYYCFESAAE